MHVVYTVADGRVVMMMVVYQQTNRYTVSSSSSFEIWYCCDIR